MGNGVNDRELALPSIQLKWKIREWRINIRFRRPPISLAPKNRTNPPPRPAPQQIPPPDFPFPFPTHRLELQKLLSQYSTIDPDTKANHNLKIPHNEALVGEGPSPKAIRKNQSARFSSDEFKLVSRINEFYPKSPVNGKAQRLQ